MIEAYREKREAKRAKERFIYSVIILFLIASSVWSLALSSQWRQALYASLKEAARLTAVKTKEAY